MIRKFAQIILICGLFHNSLCSRMRFEQPFADSFFRHDQPFRSDPGLRTEPFYKREHIFPREPLMQPEQFMQHPGLIRNEPMYAAEPLQPQPQNEGFLPNEQIMQTEPFIRTDHLLRRDPLIRRDPLMRREPLFRAEPIIRNDKIFASPPIPEPIFRSPQSYQTLMLAPIVQQEHPNIHSSFLPMNLPGMMPAGMAQPKLIQPPMVQMAPMPQSIMPFPRMHRIVRKGVRSIQDNLQFPPPTLQGTQEFPQFNTEQVQFPGNFQSQAPQQQESTSEPSQNAAVTVRNVSQMPTPLNLAQMSSIC